MCRSTKERYDSPKEKAVGNGFPSVSASPRLFLWREESNLYSLDVLSTFYCGAERAAEDAAATVGRHAKVFNNIPPTHHREVSVRAVNSSQRTSFQSIKTNPFRHALYANIANAERNGKTYLLLFIFLHRIWPREQFRNLFNRGSGNSTPRSERTGLPNQKTQTSDRAHVRCTCSFSSGLVVWFEFVPVSVKFLFFSEGTFSSHFANTISYAWFFSLSSSSSSSTFLPNLIVQCTVIIISQRACALIR